MGRSLAEWNAQIPPNLPSTIWLNWECDYAPLRGQGRIAAIFITIDLDESKLRRKYIRCYGENCRIVRKNCLDWVVVPLTLTQIPSRSA